MLIKESLLDATFQMLPMLLEAGVLSTTTECDLVTKTGGSLEGLWGEGGTPAQKQPVPGPGTEQESEVAGRGGRGLQAIQGLIVQGGGLDQGGQKFP